MRPSLCLITQWFRHVVTDRDNSSVVPLLFFVCVRIKPFKEIKTVILFFVSNALSFEKEDLLDIDECIVKSIKIR